MTLDMYRTLKFDSIGTVVTVQDGTIIDDDNLYWLLVLYVEKAYQKVYQKKEDFGLFSIKTFTNLGINDLFMSVKLDEEEIVVFRILSCSQSHGIMYLIQQKTFDEENKKLFMQIGKLVC
jgi:hypothetical protein